MDVRVTLSVAAVFHTIAFGQQDSGKNACAPCHRAICDSYQRTAMAQSSGHVGSGFGLVREDFTHATFLHSATGFRYRVTRTGGGFSLEFAKTDGSWKGAVTSAWFVGSGATARSYLLEDEGYLYESPAAYYTAGRKWDLAPGYDHYGYPYLTRPVLPGCLTCHASSLNPIADTQNRFASPPFSEPGIVCERCHGRGQQHIAQAGAHIVNPAKLDPARRDSICEQCHLAGAVRVFRPGATWNTFRPGDRLADSLTVFVKAGDGAGMTVTGHVEKLAQSACKRASGDRLWCGTCHDPHQSPNLARIREKCQGCHEASARPAVCKTDCLICHMPKNPVVDAQHVVYTDHSIPRRPRAGAPRQTSELVPFAGRTTARDQALAYAIAGSARPQDLAVLEGAARESPNDTEVLLYLAEIYRNTGKPERAIRLFERAGTELTALVGLGAIRFERGELTEAIRLWEGALAKNGGLVLVRTNLALAYWRAGNPGAAERHLVKAIALSPGLAAPADLLEKVRGKGKK